MDGEGIYQWRNTDGTLGEASNWNDIPGEMEYLIKFLPNAPEEPHTDEDHKYMDSFPARFQEVLTRCRR